MVQTGFQVITKTRVNSLLVAQVVAQNRINQAFCPSELQSMGSIDDGVNAGMCRTVQVIDAVQASEQQQMQLGILASQGFFDDLSDNLAEVEIVSYYAIADLFT